MKKILLSFTTILSLSINAQTLTQANHAPAAGEQFKRLQCDSTGILLGTSGANQLWDYSALNSHPSIISDYNVQSNSNTAYSLANVVVNVMPNSDNYYFKSSASDLKYYGGNFLMGSFGIALNFNAPAIAAIYPMSLNTATSSAISGSMTINNSISGTFTGNAGLFADGTGTLVLPAKTFTDVIKVTSSQIINATLSLGTATVTQLTVDYYSVGNPKASILTIATNTVSSSLSPGATTQTLVTILKDYINIGINETEKEEASVIVYPNPVSSVAHFTSKNNQSYKVSVYDVTGKIVGNTLFDNNVANFNIEGLKTGVYFYTVLNKSNQAIKSGKFTVE